MNDGHINASMDIDNASLDVTFGEVYEIDKGMPAAIIANLYSSQSTYLPGDYVIYRIRLYKCLVAIETPEEFDSTKWELVKVAEELKEKADKSTTYTKTETDALLDEKADANNVYTKTETDALLDEKANSDNVYTKAESDTLLDEKADRQSTLAALSTLSAAIDTKADAAGTTAALALKADKTYVDTELDKKADKSYVDTELDKKADKSSTYTKTEVDTALASKAAADSVYTKVETDEEISEAVGSINNKIASEYDEEETYYRGDIVLYNGVLYECDNTDASGEFNPSDWKEITIAEGIGDVRDIFYNYYSKTELNPLLNQKMDKTNPSGTGTLSLNRKSNTTVGNYSVATGYRSIASGTASHAENWQTTASGDASHAEGESTIASAYAAHSEGETTTASGDDSHAEGKNSTASGNVSHAEGENNIASGYGSHAEGYGNTASGLMAHAEGVTTTASGYGSHSEGVGTIANHIGQHVVGAYNTADPSAAEPTAKGNYVEIVGNGTDDNRRSNARTLDWSGNEVLAGDLTYNGNKSLTSEVQRLDNKINNLPNPMVYRGSVGVGGTVTELPVDGSANIGDTYKVITAGTYAGQLADIGDTFICEDKTASTNTWTLIPSGDEPSGTVTSIKIEATSPININDNSAITTSGIRTISHANSGVTAGSYGDTSAQTPAVGETFKALSVTVDAKGHITNVGEHTVTMPSVVNNVTGTGTSGSIAKFNGTNTITNGPEIGSDITKFLRNDGNWEVPNYVTYTFATGDNNGEIKVTPSNGQAQAISVAGLNNSAYKDFATSPIENSSDLITSGGVYTALLDKVDKNNPNCTGSFSVNRRPNSIVGSISNSFGGNNIASGTASVAFGYSGTASGYASICEGYMCEATGFQAHAEGERSIASGENSHAQGYFTIASGQNAHSEGYRTEAKGNYQHVSGKYNIVDNNNEYAEIIGNGTSDSACSNARALDWQGNETLAGNLTFNGNISLTSEISRLDNLISNKANAPTVITGTLVAGQTSITLQSPTIDNNSIISVYTTDGTEWNSMTVTTGQVVIVFYAQTNDLGVRVEVT